MTKRTGTGRGLLLATALLALAAGLFAAAFYFYDGVTVVKNLIAGAGGLSTMPSKPEPAVAAAALSLPDGMPEEFALQVWSEQLDSQRVIRPLAEGEIYSLRIAKVTVDGKRATLTGTLVFKDGTKLPGAIGMRLYGDTWYISYVSGASTASERQQHTDSLPRVADVDVALLNTVIAEQKKSRGVAQDIVDGRIVELRAGAVRTGLNTATIPLTMLGSSKERTGELIAIRTGSGGEEAWFVARFNEPKSSTD